MGKMTATRLLNETLRVREEQGAEAAYRFVRQHDAGFGEEERRSEAEKEERVSGRSGPIADARQSNLLYALASAAGHADEAMALLREAVLERGFWYPADYLLEDDDLETLRSLDGFAELADLCAKREEAALANAAPGLTVLAADEADQGGKRAAAASGTDAGVQAETAAEAANAVLSGQEAEAAARPLLLALHGDQENERDSAPFWGAASRAGWTVGLVRSSQIRFSDAFGWDDIDLGAAELREHLETLRGAASEAASVAPVVLGAFSAGAEVALNALLHDELPADGLVLVSPWLDEPGEWAEALGRLEGRTPLFALIAGAEDDEGREAAASLAEAMQAAGLECRTEIAPGTGHDYPEDFAARLDAALAWIAAAKRR